MDIHFTEIGRIPGIYLLETYFVQPSETDPLKCLDYICKYTKPRFFNPVHLNLINSTELIVVKSVLYVYCVNNRIMWRRLVLFSKILYLFVSHVKLNLDS